MTNDAEKTEKQKIRPQGGGVGWTATFWILIIILYYKVEVIRVYFFFFCFYDLSLERESDYTPR